MQCYNAMLSVSCWQAMFFTFAAPAYKTTFSAYFTAALEPMTFLIWGVLHQSKIWFRFRNWVKKCYDPLFCRGNNLLALSIWEDIYFDGRGSDNFFPAYQRTRVQNEISSMMGTMYASLFYMIVSVCLRYLPNKHHFPYYQPRGGEIAVGYSEFTAEGYKNSIIFATLIFIFVALSLLVYRLYLFHFYPSLRPVFREFIWKAHTHPHKLGFQMMIVSAIGMMVVKLFLSFSRIWWVNSGMCKWDVMPQS